MATADEALAALDQASRNNLTKQGLSTQQAAAGVYHSLWRVDGQPPGGAIPGAVAGVAPDKDTFGAIRFPDPGAGEAATLLKLGGSFVSELGPLTLYDRLLHTSGLSGSAITLQTVNTIPFTRGGPEGFINGEDVELFLEVYAALGTVAANLTVNYTDPGGTARSSVVALAATTLNSIARMWRIPTYDGGFKGFKSVQSVQLSISTGAAGNWGLTFARRLAELPIGLTADAGMDKNMFELGAPALDGEACLALLFASEHAGNPSLMGDIYIGDL